MRTQLQRPQISKKVKLKKFKKTIDKINKKYYNRLIKRKESQRNEIKKFKKIKKFLTNKTPYDIIKIQRTKKIKKERKRDLIMANKKLTKKEMFTLVMDVVETTECEMKEEMMDFLNHEIELLEHKKSNSAKTKTQVENEKIMFSILEELALVGKPVTISELQAQSEKMKEFSNQKLSSLLKKLVDENKVVKTTEKKKSFFSVAEV